MRKTGLHLLLISVVGIIIYSNTLNSPFIWDDTHLILENGNIRDLSHFLDLSGTRYLTFLSLAVNYRINGYHVTGYHIFNITMHLLNAMLVYLLVITIFRTPVLRELPTSRYSRFSALFAGLLFVSHPVYTQAVTNINQRSILLATFFYLSALTLFINARLNSDTFFCRKHLLYYFLSAVAAILAMKCKEVSFTLPFVIMLCDRYFTSDHRSLTRSVIYAIPVLLTLFIIPLDRPQSDVFEIGEPNAFGIKDGNVLSGLNEKILSGIARKDYIMTELRVILTYIRLFFLPVNLNLDYDYPIFDSFLNPHVLLSFLSLLLIMGLGIYFFYCPRKAQKALLLSAGASKGKSALPVSGNSSRLVSFGILWFFITLSVESVLVVLKFVIFEYRLYLPSIGIILVLNALTGYFLAYISRTISKAILILAIVMIFSIATYKRNEVYMDEITLWSDVVKKSPYLGEFHNALGVAYAAQGYLKEAIQEYRTILRSRPDNAVTHNNLGLVYFRQGRFNEALEEYKAAIRLNPNYAKAHNSLGFAYDNQGLLNEAIEEYKAALTLNPNLAETRNNLGLSYSKQGRLNEAIEEYKAALTLNPNLAETRNNLGLSYSEQGRLNEAIEEYKAALTLNPNLAETRNNLGTAYFRQGSVNEAEREYQSALRINPGYAIARENLQNIHKKTAK